MQGFFAAPINGFYCRFFLFYYIFADKSTFFLISF